MQKSRPGGGSSLVVEGSFAGFRSVPDRHTAAVYSVQSDDDLMVLDDVQWADWAADGRLLVATTDGALQVRSVDGTNTEVGWSHDLAALEPDPQPAPSWASEP